MNPLKGKDKLNLILVEDTEGAGCNACVFGAEREIPINKAGIFADIECGCSHLLTMHGCVTKDNKGGHWELKPPNPPCACLNCGRTVCVCADRDREKAKHILDHNIGELMGRQAEECEAERRAACGACGAWARDIRECEGCQYEDKDPGEDLL